MYALLFYVGLGGILTLEVAGVFLLPGDISLVAAGLHGAQGGSQVLVSWAAASIGMVAGASILFHGLSRSNRLQRAMPERVVSLVRRHHVYGVAVARLVPGLRNATVFAAAGAGLPYRVFLLGLVPAALVWSGVLLALGWFGGDAMLTSFGHFHNSRLLQLISLGILFLAVLFVLIRIHSRSQDDNGEQPPVA